MNEPHYDFFDLPPDERSNVYQKAEEETGQNFFDLPPEDRAAYYNAATREFE
jgi:hypothetical protein